MQEKDNLVLIILSGIPCSGKSTWIEENTLRLYDKYQAPIITICRDTIRETKFGKNYKFSKEREDQVTKEFYNQMRVASTFKQAVIILDNTHCRESYIDTYLATYRGLQNSGKMEIYVKFFEIPLWKSYARNMWRNLRTGKWIPISVIKAMYRNYKKINKDKYKHLFSNDL